MDFKPSTFGVKITETEIFITSIETESKSSRYNYKVLSAYNENMSYNIDVQLLTSQKYISFYNWKITSLQFLGNYFGQVGYCKLEDSFGKTLVIPATCQAWFRMPKI